MTSEVLRDLARVKVAFQLRTVEAVIRGPAIAAATGTAKTRNGAECASIAERPVQQGIAQTSIPSQEQNS